MGGVQVIGRGSGDLNGGEPKGRGGCALGGDPRGGSVGQ
jgi:hypothetical protein